MRNNIADSDMYRQVMSLPEQIESALVADLGDFDGFPAAKKVCVYGMGASALAGNVVSDYSDSVSGPLVEIIRDVELPGWIDEDSIVFLVSYSGDTHEVLTAYDRTMERGCKTVCISSGGLLSERCKNDGGKLIRVEPGLTSRGAIGLIIGSIASVISKLNIGDMADNLRAILPELREHRDRLAHEDQWIAEGLANDMFEKIPVIYALDNMRSVAMRWKSQLNENSKSLAFFGSFPEFNHNEIVGWIDDKEMSMLFRPVVLSDMEASSKMRRMSDTSIAMLADKKVKMVTYNVDGSNSLSKNLKCILTGDLVSLYLADLRGIDPLTNGPIKDIKDRIANDGTYDESTI